MGFRMGCFYRGEEGKMWMFVVVVWVGENYGVVWIFEVMLGEGYWFSCHVLRFFYCDCLD